MDNHTTSFTCKIPYAYLPRTGVCSSPTCAWGFPPGPFMPVILHPRMCRRSIMTTWLKEDFTHDGLYLGWKYKCRIYAMGTSIMCMNNYEIMKNLWDPRWRGLALDTYTNTEVVLVNLILTKMRNMGLNFEMKIKSGKIWNYSNKSCSYVHQFEGKIIKYVVPQHYSDKNEGFLESKRTDVLRRSKQFSCCHSAKLTHGHPPRPRKPSKQWRGGWSFYRLTGQWICTACRFVVFRGGRGFLLCSHNNGFLASKSRLCGPSLQESYTERSW